MSDQLSSSAQSVTEMVEGLARAARVAQRQLAQMDSPAKEQALKFAADALRSAEAEILAANAQDMANGAANGLSPAMLDRLKLTPERLAGVADAVAQVASLTDPVGQVIDETARPNGMVLQRVRVPVGVIGIIYESRPNVTADAPRCACGRAMPRSCAAAVKPSIPTARYTQRWSKASPKAACPLMRCSLCRHRIARQLAQCWQRRA